MNVELRINRIYYKGLFILVKNYFYNFNQIKCITYHKFIKFIYFTSDSSTINANYFSCFIRLRSVTYHNDFVLLSRISSKEIFS